MTLRQPTERHGGNARFDEENEMTHVITAAHDAVPTGEITSQPTEPSLIGGIQTDAHDHQRADHLARRFRVVLLDLGLDGTVPNDWVDYALGGVSFKNLTQRQADYLIRTLEDVAVDQERRVPTPGPDQLSLFGDGQ
jgi:hypothetical protein